MKIKKKNKKKKKGKKLIKLQIDDQLNHTDGWIDLDR